MPNANATSLDQIVTAALLVKDRLPSWAQSWVEDCQNGEATIDFQLEKQSHGWVWSLTFPVPEEAQGVIGSRIHHPRPEPLPTKREAFLAGAAALCNVFTGSKRLPFIATDTDLIVAGYGTGGFTGIFAMKRPGPWL